MEEQTDEEQIENIPKEKLHVRRCPYCKQEYQTKTGFDNWKNLFRKPTLDDWIVLVILLLLLLAAFAYTTDTKACRDMISRMKAENFSFNYGNGIQVNNFTGIDVNNFTVVNPETNDSSLNSTEPVINETTATTNETNETATVNKTVSNKTLNSTS